MVSVTEAIQLILDNAITLDSINVSIEDSLGLVLAQNIRSTENLPLFDNSAVDGYAVISADAILASADNRISLKIVDTIRAGEFPDFSINSGEAAKIMTGAAVPKGADSVVKIEDVTEKEGTVILGNKVEKSANVRFEGEEIQKDEIALQSGVEITPATIGFIAEFGINTVDVIRPPKVSVVVTGEELSEPGEELEPGKIRDTNSITLKTALVKENMELISIERVADSKSKIEEGINRGLESSDILITTGGVSVGEYDFVKDILASKGVEEIFWGISQRPGGPMYFGRKENKLVFGLPGNPASALVCYYEYVRPAIRKMAGKKEVLLKEEKAQLMAPIKKKTGKMHFIRGLVTRDNGDIYVKTTGEQGSHMMRSFALSNSLIILGEEDSYLPENSKVKIHILP